MPRMGALEREESKSLILVCRARGYNHKQILSVVNDNLRKYNNILSEKGLLNIIQRTKNDAQEWLKNLSVGKDDYIDEYKQRIMELNEQRRDLWEMVRKYENQPFVQIAAHKEIHALTKSIMHLYEILPLILNNSNNTNNQFDPIIYEDTTSLYPEISVQ
jgi:replicative DNA helicase